ncbi:MAG: hypothetical protein N5P05_001993 [Chroococcopsis gigantea SAG 12.99]|jgi:hypothetical protein|nr:hypothetical protein [Chlorogloea purpurea SAG 13.99]MDV3000387.1 hypothetical protein [Chroococcopsis gigantea SAG 12.99]
MLLEKIVRELQQIPPDKLPQFYEVIHDFRRGLTEKSTGQRKLGLLKGKLGDAFYEPLPEEELQQWE